MKVKGLTQAEADLRLKKDGLNQVPEPEFSFWKEFAGKLWNLSAWILEAALLLECALGKWIQSLFVLLMLLFAAYNGATKKKKSRKVLSSISQQLTPVVAVLRDDRWQKIDSKYLVVGDIVNLQRGDILAADIDLLDGNLTLDESSITGEAKNVHKKAGATAFAGTTVMDGEALGRVSATGTNSRSGQTINLINTSAAPSHLQQLLTKIIYYLCLLDGVLTIILLIAAVIRGENILEMLPFLAMMFIASIPVAMPSTFALSNSFEATRLSKEGVLTSDLTGIQDAANLNLLLLDKTGTITENKTAVASFANFSKLSDEEVLALTSLAIDQRNQSVIDLALMDFLQEKKIPVKEAEAFTPFTSSQGYSEGRGEGHDVKLGSVKQFSKIDPAISEQIADVDLSLGRSVGILLDDRLAGIFITKDKVRTDSKAALAELVKRGIKPVMLTGDNQKTAASVAEEVGLTGKVISISDFKEGVKAEDLAGIADVLPEDKLDMVKYFQKAGYIVGMTGDGVNDSPALKQAEVGIAVSNAADVAKKSSKMVLLDEGLSPIVKILDAGHRVYQRMTTWSLTKLARTAELTTLLTFSYLIFGYLPMALNAMVIYTIMNDMVTMMIGTDKTHITYKPENWDMGKLAKIAFSLAGAWTIIGFVFVSALTKAGVNHDQVGTMVYVFLVMSAMMIVLITRTKRFFWQSAPSKPVASVQIADILLTCLLALLGIAMPAIGIKELLTPLAVAFLSAILIDLVYQPVMKNK